MKRIVDEFGKVVDNANSKREAFVWGIGFSVLWFLGWLLYAIIIGK